jgi:anti-sigma28 factor (negative regulator of flagellin synthesis)
MEIKIGADELILWLRKNKKAGDVDNATLGRNIADLILKLDGEAVEENCRSFWADDLSEAAMTRLKIPITSGQYKIDTKKLPEIFEKISNW